MLTMSPMKLDHLELSAERKRSRSSIKVDYTDISCESSFAEGVSLACQMTKGKKVKAEHSPYYVWTISLLLMHQVLDNMADVEELVKTLAKLSYAESHKKFCNDVLDYTEEKGHSVAVAVKALLVTEAGVADGLLESKGKMISKGSNVCESV